jgi:hypothetical protein
LFRKSTSDNDKLPAETATKTDTGTPTEAELSEVAFKYNNFLVLALNEGELSSFSACIQHICSPDVKFMFHVYNCKEYSQGQKKPTNLFGDFTYGELSYLEMLHFYSNFLLIVPDSHTRLVSSRCCYSRECQVYISTFHTEGTIICKDSNLALTDGKGMLTFLRPVSTKALFDSSIEGYSKPYRMEGSLIMYRNLQGKINCIEWYYEFLETDCSS